jgi:diaminopimelate epimerase
MMQLLFTKMQGLGNDFIVLDGISQKLKLTTQDYTRLADRHFGIGCDQILVVEAAEQPENDFRYRIFNADGSEVEQCGNGARCFARFVFDQGLTQKTCIRVETKGGVITPTLTQDGLVTVNMGIPRFQPTEIPFIAETTASYYPIDILGNTRQISVVSMGNPHAVQIVSDIIQAPVATEGAATEQHSRFPQRVNAGFMQIMQRDRIDLRVFERGSGETLACGSGACAAVVAGIQNGLLAETVQVNMRGGSLQITWRGENTPVLMTGPAITVFSGKIEINNYS